MADTIKTLTNLYKHDLAACEVYKDVLKHIQDSDKKEKIQEFLEDHERHIKDLSSFIEEENGEKPSDWRDLKGVMLDMYAQLRSLTGETGALKALQTAENTVFKQYQEASSEDFKDAVKDLIQKNFQDEEKHQSFLQSLKL